MQTICVVDSEAGTCFQCFTILWQQPGIQALEVRNTRGEWIDAPPIPGTLVIKCVLYALGIVLAIKAGFVAV
jgi:hypothetical protein